MSVQTKECMQYSRPRTMRLISGSCYSFSSLGASSETSQVILGTKQYSLFLRLQHHGPSRLPECPSAWHNRGRAVELSSVVECGLVYILCVFECKFHDLQLINTLNVFVIYNYDIFFILT